MNKGLMTPETLSERWNITQVTLSQWRVNGRGPRFLKLGRKVMYRIQDIEEFEEQNARSDTSLGSNPRDKE